MGTVVVADWRCDWVGLGLATMLSTGGRRMVLASSGYFAGQRIQQYVRDQMTIAARKARVDMRSTLRPFGADDTTVYLQDVLTGEAVIVEDAVALVLATGHVPDGALLEELTAVSAAGGGFDVRGIGDVLGPRTIEEAVLDGLRAGSRSGALVRRRRPLGRAPRRGPESPGTQSGAVRASVGRATKSVRLSSRSGPTRRRRESDFEPPGDPRRVSGSGGHVQPRHPSLEARARGPGVRCTQPCCP